MKAAALLARLDPKQGEKPPAKVATPPAFSPDDSVVDPQGFLAMIEMMRGRGDYDWADRTLVEIYDTVEASKRVTEGQRRAVFNIRDARGSSR